MSMMFRDAVTFDQPLGDWDTSYVMDMTSMFRGAVLFKQDLSTWDVSRLRLDGGDRFAENSGIEEIPEFGPLF